jgi:hypothetical protein
MKNKHIRIEETHIDLEALKAANHTPASLKKTEIFSHLPEGKQEAAYQALQTELDAYDMAPASVTVQKGNSIKTVAAEAPKGKSK